MTPYHESDGVTLYHGDCLQVLRTLPAESIDAVVSDPPYGLSFMGKRWDYDVPTVEVWAECLRVLKPGGHLLAFAGTRTQHRMAVRIEDAGFEIRDMIAWVYGSGFPKSLDVSKAIDKAAGAEREVVGINEDYLRRKPNGMKTAGATAYGYSQSQQETDARITAPATPEAQRWQGWGTALKPALEPITVARKPLSGTVAENVLQHGTGALNVDGCRVEANGDRLGGGRISTTTDGWDRPWKHDSEAIEACKARGDEAVAKAERLGRWPANLIHDGSDEVTRLFPETGAARQADRGKGIDGATFKHMNCQTSGIRGHNDAGGSAARFFYCAKASKRDRGETNKHPTVKPTALMRYLCKLITPPSGLILDPFTGSGSTGRGAVLEGFRFVGMELDAEHVEEAKRRILEVQNGWTDEPEDDPIEDLPGQRLLF